MLQACTIEGNDSATTGGGVAIETSHPRIQDCLLHANTSGTSGGGLSASLSSSASLVNVTMIDNVAAGGMSHDAYFQYGSAALSGCIL